MSTVADSYATSVLDAAVEFAWHSGIVVVVAAGNGGPNAPLTSPANDPFVISVGATDDLGTVSTADDRLAAFSSFGVTRDGVARPDLVAPGRHIVSTLSSHQSPLAMQLPGQGRRQSIHPAFGNLGGGADGDRRGRAASAGAANAPAGSGQVAARTHRPRGTRRGHGAGYPRLDAALRYTGPVGSADAASRRIGC